MTMKRWLSRFVVVSLTALVFNWALVDYGYSKPKFTCQTQWIESGVDVSTCTPHPDCQGTCTYSMGRHEQCVRGNGDNCTGVTRAIVAHWVYESECFARGIGCGCIPHPHGRFIGTIFRPSQVCN